MQIDMHCFGTYALARAAGLKTEVAARIATAAQLVDDNAIQNALTFGDAARIDAEATAHHTLDLRHNVKIANLNDEDQRRVWVPFHFLPGNTGETYEERLLCRKDSPVARTMLDHHLNLAQAPFAVELIGIAAHVYADTFSHYGFSGIASPTNCVDNDAFAFDDGLKADMKAYISKKAAEFWETFSSWGAENLTGALGHAGAATFPDRPYLRWSLVFENREGGREGRDNPADYLQGCRGLYGLFRNFADRRPDCTDGPGREWPAMAERVEEILKGQADQEGRIEAWRNAAADGSLFGLREALPAYGGNEWQSEFVSLDGTADSGVSLKTPMFRFFQAAAHHRVYVLRDLLPSCGLVAD